MANVNVDNNKMWFIEPGCAVISHGRYGIRTTTITRFPFMLLPSAGMLARLKR